MQKQLPRLFYKKGILRNFTEFTGIRLCQSLYNNKAQKIKKNKSPKKFLSFPYISGNRIF